MKLRPINRPLGAHQKDMLDCMRDHKKWYPGCGWLWTTPSRTIQLLDSLVRRGLVNRAAGKHPYYVLSEAGENYKED